MQSLYIEGQRELKGQCDIITAKNAILPIIAASIMCVGPVYIGGYVGLTDVISMTDILTSLGCTCSVDDSTLVIDSTCISSYYIKAEYTSKIRSSIFMLGPLLSRLRSAKVAYPGGCNIGARPIDLHLKGLRDLGVHIVEKHGYIYCDGSNMRAGEVHLDFPSVGATENLIMASVFLKGTTTIYNAAREPEIVDLVHFLRAMGAMIYGEGTCTIVVQGVDTLHSVHFTPIKDRIVAGTYMIACAVAGGSIRLNGAKKEHNMALISKLGQAGVNIECGDNYIDISSSGRPISIPSIDTQVYPGFPTDLQSQMLVLQCYSNGTSVISENLFETRFKVCTELIKMGADITLKDRMAIVKGVPTLYGADIDACDLRGGAALVLAGLGAQGYTTVRGVEHIDRGYSCIERDLKSLGANISRTYE